MLNVDRCTKYINRWYWFFFYYYCYYKGQCYNGIRAIGNWAILQHVMYEDVDYIYDKNIKL